MFASASQSKQEQNDIKVVGKGRNDPNVTISADLAIMKRGRVEYSTQHNANKRKAKTKVKSSKPKKMQILMKRTLSNQNLKLTKTLMKKF